MWQRYTSRPLPFFGGVVWGVGSNRDAVTLWQLFPLSIYTGWRICCLKTRWKNKYYKYCKLILLTEDNLKVTEECKRRRQQLKLELTSQSLANVIRCKISHIFSYYFFYFSFSSLNMSSVWPATAAAVRWEHKCWILTRKRLINMWTGLDGDVTASNRRLSKVQSGCRALDEHLLYQQHHIRQVIKTPYLAFKQQWDADWVSVPFRFSCLFLVNSAQTLLWFLSNCFINVVLFYHRSWSGPPDNYLLTCDQSLFLPHTSNLPASPPLPSHSHFLDSIHLHSHLSLPITQRSHIFPSGSKHAVWLGQVFSGQPLSEEAPGAWGRAVHVWAMPDHPGLGGPGRGQHPGSRGLRPVGWGGQGHSWTQHHHLLLHSSCGLHLRRAVLCRVWGAGSQDGLSVPVQLRDCWRAAGFCHRLESFTLLRHRWVKKVLFNV